LLYLVMAALAALAAGICLPVLRRNHRLDEVDRFHVARSLTTSWSDHPDQDVKVPAEGEQLTD
jgi:hypothetical protein